MKQILNPYIDIVRLPLLYVLLVTVAAAVSACASVELEQKEFPLFSAVTAEGDSYRTMYEPSAEEKQLDYNHLKVMVLEESFLQNGNAYETMLNAVQKEDTYPRNVYVCVTADLSQLMNLPDVSAADLGTFLEELLEKQKESHVTELVTIGELIDEKENRCKTLYLPYLEVSGDSVSWSGTYAIRKSIPQGVVADSLQPAIAGKILRFHVIANSDSEEDQAVKLMVRDAVGAQMGEWLEDAGNLEASEQIVVKQLGNIRETAEAVLRNEGYTYSVSAGLSTVEFPEKTYGAFTFPAGEYEALQVVLGDGQGQNWWCVLYPNLCFKGSVYEADDEAAEEALREVLTAEEFAEVFDSGQVKIRLKFLEYFRKKR